MSAVDPNVEAPWNPAVRPPPPGVTPNFTSAATIAYKVYLAAAICLTFMIMASGVRLYARVSGTMAKKTWTSDIVFAVSVLGAMLYIVLTIVATTYGFYGKHLWDILFLQFKKEPLVLSLMVEALYPCFLFLIKLALLLFYLDIFGRLRWMRISVYIGIAIIAPFHIANFIIYPTMCAPRTGTKTIDYLISLATPRCLRTGPLIVGQGVFNIISDVYLLALPMPAVWSLQLPLKKKLGVVAMFLTGSVALIASCLGLHYRTKLKIEHELWTDITYLVVPSWITSFVEMTAGIVVLCMPAVTVVTKAATTQFRSFISSARQALNYDFSNKSGSRSRSGKDSANTSLSDRSGSAPDVNVTEKSWYDNKGASTTMQSVDSEPEIPDPTHQNQNSSYEMGSAKMGRFHRILPTREPRVSSLSITKQVDYTVVHEV